MRRIGSLLVWVLVLVGCGNELAQRQAFLNQFIGRPESDLLQHLGVPSRAFQTASGVKYLAYTESRVEVLPGTPMWGPWPWRGWNGGGFPPEVVTRVCETTFAVSDGVVRSYTLRGNACG